MNKPALTIGDMVYKLERFVRESRDDDMDDEVVCMSIILIVIVKAAGLMDTPMPDPKEMAQEANRRAP